MESLFIQFSYSIAKNRPLWLVLWSRVTYKDLEEVNEYKNTIKTGFCSGLEYTFIALYK